MTCALASVAVGGMRDPLEEVQSIPPSELPERREMGEKHGDFAVEERGRSLV